MTIIKAVAVVEDGRRPCRLVSGFLGLKWRGQLYGYRVPCATGPAESMHPSIDICNFSVAHISRIFRYALSRFLHSHSFATHTQTAEI